MRCSPQAGGGSEAVGALARLARTETRRAKHPAVAARQGDARAAFQKGASEAMRCSPQAGGGSEAVGVLARLARREVSKPSIQANRIESVAARSGGGRGTCRARVEMP